MNRSVYIIKTDRDGKYTYANDYFMDTFSPNEDILGTDSLHLIHPDDHITCYEAVEKCFQKPNVSHHTVLRKPTPNGGIQYNRWEFKGLTDDNGNVSEILCIGFDVTKERESEQKAKKAVRFYKTLLDNQSVYVIKTDIHGNYIYINDLFKRRFADGKDLLGTSLTENIIEEDHEKCFDAVNQCFMYPNTPIKVTLRKPNGEEGHTYSEWEFKGLINEEGVTTEILCVGYDVTEVFESLQNSQELLDLAGHQNTRLQNFAYIISHNIRSHSANLTSLVELMEDTEGEEERQQCFDMLKTSTKKLSETIESLNEIVAINRDINKPRKKVNLYNVIQNTLDILKGTILQKKVDVQLNVPKVLELYTIPAYLDSIFLNLVSNAIKYSSPERTPKVTISVFENSREIILKVADNGLGIDLDRYGKKLFKMYKTFHNNDDARGIGLFITKNQVEALQGKISVESTVNKGTTFTINFLKNEK